MISITSLYTDDYSTLIFENAKNVDCGEVESTHIGIKSIRGMMEEMDGSCGIEESQNLYKIVLLFKRIS